MKWQKKAVGDAISTLILFIAVISVTTGLVIVFKDYVFDSQTAFQSQSELTSNKIKTSISITNIYYNQSSNVSYIYVKNVGETKLNTELFDLFIDGKFYESFNISDATDLTTPVIILNLQETVAIIKNINLTSGSHNIVINTEYGVGDEESFNI